MIEGGMVGCWGLKRVQVKKKCCTIVVLKCVVLYSLFSKRFFSEKMNCTY